MRESGRIHKLNRCKGLLRVEKGMKGWFFQNINFTGIFRVYGKLLT